MEGIIPNNLDPKLIKSFNEYQSDKKPGRIKLDYVYIIFKEIQKKVEFRRKIEKSDNPHLYAPVHSDFFRKVVGGYANFYKKFLIECGYIQVEENVTGGSSYMVGKFSMSYRIHPKFIKNGYKFINISDKKIQEKYKIYRSKCNKSENANEIRMKLIEFAKQVKLDWEAINEFREHYHLTEITTDKLQSILHILRDYHDVGLYYDAKDNYGERLHTTWTWSYKKCRDFLYYHDKKNKLKELDIANSQLYFLALCFTENAVDLLPEYRTSLMKIREYSKAKDIKKFVKWATDGKFYQRIATKIYGLRPEGKDWPDVKAKIKELVFGWIYSRRDPQTKEEKKLSEIFPSVCIIRKQFSEYNERKGRTQSLLPKFLQRMESRVMIDRLADKFIKGGCSEFITVHDSFLYQEKDEDLLGHCLMELFDELELPMPSLK